MTSLIEHSSGPKADAVVHDVVSQEFQHVRDVHERVSLPGGIARMREPAVLRLHVQASVGVEEPNRGLPTVGWRQVAHHGHDLESGVLHCGDGREHDVAGHQRVKVKVHWLFPVTAQATHHQHLELLNTEQTLFVRIVFFY